MTDSTLLNINQDIERIISTYLQALDIANWSATCSTFHHRLQYAPINGTYLLFSTSDYAHYSDYVLVMHKHFKCPILTFNNDNVIHIHRLQHIIVASGYFSSFLKSLRICQTLILAHEVFKIGYYIMPPNLNKLIIHSHFQNNDYIIESTCKNVSILSAIHSPYIKLAANVCHTVGQMFKVFSQKNTVYFQWPFNIEKLKICHSHYVPNMPLTHLRHLRIKYMSRLMSTDLSHLTHLKTFKCMRLYSYNKVHWPESIKKVTISYKFGYNLDQLPSSLTSLVVHDVNYTHFKIPSHCTSLIKLKIYGEFSIKKNCTFAFAKTLSEWTCRISTSASFIVKNIDFE